MMNELANMKKRDVWTTIDYNDLPPDKKPIGLKWVFKVKENGTHKARLVAFGFLQIPGVDFNESHAPVVNDTTFPFILIMRITKKYWVLRQLDVEAELLEGCVDKELYIKFPKGMELITKRNDNVARLNK